MSLKNAFIIAIMVVNTAASPAVAVISDDRSDSSKVPSIDDRQPHYDKQYEPNTTEPDNETLEVNKRLGITGVQIDSSSNGQVEVVNISLALINASQTVDLSKAMITWKGPNKYTNLEYTDSSHTSLAEGQFTVSTKSKQTDPKLKEKCSRATISIDGAAVSSGELSAGNSLEIQITTQFGNQIPVKLSIPHSISDNQPVSIEDYETDASQNYDSSLSSVDCALTNPTTASNNTNGEEGAGETGPGEQVTTSSGNLTLVNEEIEKTSFDSVPLDRRAVLIAETYVQGTPYKVYKIENALPYASGIEVYSNGRKITEEAQVKPVLSQIAARRTLDTTTTGVSAARITSESAAQTQFRVAAWQASANDISAEDIQQLRDISETASQIDEIVSPALSTINTALGLFETMKNTGLLGVTVWDVAANAYPQLRVYEASLQEIQTELKEWDTIAEEVTNDINPAIQALEQAQDGENIDYSEVSNQLVSTENSLDRLESKSDNIESSISAASEEAASLGDAMAKNEVPNEYVQSVYQLSTELDATASQVASFRQKIDESQSELEKTRQKAQKKQTEFMAQWRSERSRLLDGWQTRNTASSRVFGTFGGVGILLLSLFFIGYWIR